MAVKFEFVSGLLCERVLIDQDKLISAIRIADIFQVPDGTPEGTPIQFYAVVSLRTLPVPDVEVKLTATLVRVSGEREILPDPSGGNLYKLRESSPDPSLPGGLSFVMQLNIVPKNFGTCVLEISVDGEIAVKVPFTIRRIPAIPAQ